MPINENNRERLSYTEIITKIDKEKIAGAEAKKANISAKIRLHIQEIVEGSYTIQELLSELRS